MLIGVDFGGTHVKAGVVEGGEVIRSTSAATRAGSAPEEILDVLAGAVLALSPKPQGVGIAIPGITVCPVSSITCAPAGTATDARAPTAAIRPF